MIASPGSIGEVFRGETYASGEADAMDNEETRLPNAAVTSADRGV